MMGDDNDGKFRIELQQHVRSITHTCTNTHTHAQTQTHTKQIHTILYNILPSYRFLRHTVYSRYIAELRE